MTVLDDLSCELEIILDEAAVAETEAEVEAEFETEFLVEDEDDRFFL